LLSVVWRVCVVCIDVCCVQVCMPVTGVRCTTVTGLPCMDSHRYTLHARCAVHASLLRRPAVSDVRRRMCCMARVHCTPGLRCMPATGLRCTPATAARCMPGARWVTVTGARCRTDRDRCRLHARCRCALPGSDSYALHARCALCARCALSNDDKCALHTATGLCRMTVNGVRCLTMTCVRCMLLVR
jgi:hypothetical protein